jgi:hypothetical protein
VALTGWRLLQAAFPLGAAPVIEPPVPPLLTHERFPGGLAGSDTFFFSESATLLSATLL